MAGNAGLQLHFHPSESVKLPVVRDMEEVR